MSKLTVATWNAEGMFVEGTMTRRASPHDALNVLRELGADVVVIPEFGSLGGLRDEIRTTILALGYQIAAVPYREARTPGLGFVILSRLPIVSEHAYDLAITGRSMLEIVCKNESGGHLRVIGVHLDDRGEDIRMAQIRDVVRVVNENVSLPTLLMGDMNAMHEKSKFALFVRSKLAHRVIKHIAHPQIAKMSKIVQDMALGTTINYLLKETLLHDLDLGRKRTISGRQRGLEWIPAFRLAKIDWIFGTKHISVQSYRVYRDVGSDHRPVVAKIIY